MSTFAWMVFAFGTSVGSVIGYKVGRGVNRTRTFVGWTDERD